MSENVYKDVAKTSSPTQTVEPVEARRSTAEPSDLEEHGKHERVPKARRPSSAPFPDHVKQRALELVEQGRSLVEVAQEVGVSRQTLSSWAYKEGIGTALLRARYSDALKQQVLTRLREVPLDTVVAETGFPVHRLRVWARAEGIKIARKKPRRYSAAERAAALELLRIYPSLWIVHSVTGIVESTLIKWANLAGLAADAGEEWAQRYSEVIGHLASGLPVSRAASLTGVAEDAVRDWGTATGHLPTGVRIEKRRRVLAKLEGGQTVADVLASSRVQLGVVLYWLYGEDTGAVQRASPGSQEATPPINAAKGGEIRDLIGRGMSPLLAAQEVGVSLPELKKWAAAQGLQLTRKKTKLDESTWQQVLKLVAEGMSINKIAATVQTNANNLRTRLRKENIPFAGRRRFTTETRQAVVARVLDGASITVIAKELDVGKDLVHYWLRVAGHPGVQPSGPHPDEMRREALRLFRKGEMITVVQKETGIARSTLRRWAKQEGVVPASMRYTDSVRETALAQMRETGEAVSVHNALGVPLDTLRTWARKAGVDVERRKRRKYTQVQRDQAMELLGRFGAIAVVARLTKIPPTLLSLWAHKVGVSFAPGGVDIYDDVVARLRSGYTVRDVAMSTGLPEQTVTDWGFAAGAIQTVEYGTRVKAEAMALFERGCSLARVAEDTGVPVGTLVRWQSNIVDTRPH